tara:strand:- start:2052 stop:2765 length:714 start_codon:yes stop_codon:yes gene_type:complete
MKRIFCFISGLLIVSCQVYANDNYVKVNKSAESKIVEVSSLSKIETKIRNAAVVVTNGKYTVTGSGTYVSLGRKKVVITAAHVVRDFSDIIVIGRVGEKVAASVIYRDKKRDIAVLSVPDIKTRSPVKFAPTKTKPRDLIGLNVTYTGFPNRLDLMTINGRVSGYDSSTGFILLHSFTWPGASGSCVFDHDGNLIGVLSMVSVGEYEVRQIIEDVVWIAPISDASIRDIVLAIEARG